MWLAARLLSRSQSLMIPEGYVEPHTLKTALSAPYELSDKHKSFACLASDEPRRLSYAASNSPASPQREG